MELSCKMLSEKIEKEFSLVYVHFKEFQLNTLYRDYWRKCLEAVEDRDLLSNIVFCNDIFNIPPVKTFLTYYENDFVTLTGRVDAELDVFVKKSIGAFWGMVFKYCLGYQGQRSTTVSMNKKFKVSTATYFENPKVKIRLI